MVVLSCLAKKNQKDLIILPTARGVLADFWVLNEIDSFFIDFVKPLKIWAYLDNYFFHSFQGGTKGKMLKNQCIIMANFQHFSFGPALKTMKKKLSK